MPLDWYCPVTSVVHADLYPDLSTTGGGAFLALAGYNYFSGMGHLERQKAAILQSKSMFGMRSRKLGVASISIGLAYLGIWRLFR